MSRANEAHYELIRGKAVIRQRMPYTADSVMRQVCNYYDKHGDRKRQMEAHYVLACAYLDGGQQAKAFNHLHRTVLLPDTSSIQCD